VIALSLAEISDVVGGEVVGADGPVTVDGPVVQDGREAGPGGLYVAFVGERSDGHDHADQAAANGAVAALGSRPMSLPTVVVADVQHALQRLAAHVVAQLRRTGELTVLAVTGSQGKTSTKDLLAAVLSSVAPTVATRGSYNNEIGMPLTALRADATTRFLLLEMGARGRGHIAELADLVTPDVAMVLNVGVAHLGEFGSREAIAQAKGELVESLTAAGTAVLNADDDTVAPMAARTTGTVLTFGRERPADVRVQELTLDRLGRPSFVLAVADQQAPVTLRLVGGHQALNAAAAAAGALAVGIPLPDVAEALSAVAELSPWRMELHELSSGVTVLNDAYNANPDSMRAALDALAVIGADPAVRRTVAILGEMRELGESSAAEHRAMGEYAAGLGIDEVVSVGEPAREIGGTFLADNAAATAWVSENVGPGDAVLFKASNGVRLYEVADALRRVGSRV
jgi:UDP-N-acetylmuramoyl-tripeptide--D-alanyl-D-alanine ligase